MKQKGKTKKKNKTKQKRREDKKASKPIELVLQRGRRRRRRTGRNEIRPCSLGTRTVKSVTTRERNTRERKPEKSDTMSDVMRINCSFISIKRQCRSSLINTNLRLGVHTFYSNIVTRFPIFFFSRNVGYFRITTRKIFLSFPSSLKFNAGRLNVWS